MITYRVCTDRDIPALKRIWLTCFDEREDAIELFFQRNKDSYHAYACEEDGALVSALYLIDCALCGARAHYLCGAATLPAYRGRGIMAGLIDFALRDAETRGDRFSLLFPASGSLYEYYARFGYLRACAMKSAILSTDTAEALHSGTPDLHALQLGQGGTAVLWDDAFIRFAADYYALYGAKSAQSADAFVIYEPDGEAAEVYYAPYDSLEELKALLRTEGIRRFRLIGAADDPAFEGEISRPFGMIRPLDNDTAPADAYIGVTLQ